MFPQKYLECQVELIDTLWNVNNISWQGTFTPSLELIDTLWNVNSLGLGVEGNPEKN